MGEVWCNHCIVPQAVLCYPSRVLDIRPKQHKRRRAERDQNDEKSRVKGLVYRLRSERARTGVEQFRQYATSLLKGRTLLEWNDFLAGWLELAREIANERRIENNPRGLGFRFAIKQLRRMGWHVQPRRTPGDFITRTVIGRDGKPTEVPVRDPTTGRQLRRPGGRLIVRVGRSVGHNEAEADNVEGAV